MKIKSLHNTLRINLGIIALLLFTVGLQAQQLDSTATNIQSYFDRALRYQNRNELNLALETLNKAAELSQQKEDDKAWIDSYHKLALLYLKLGNEKSSIFFSDRAKGMLEEVEYPYGDAMQKYLEAVRLFNEGKNYQAIFSLEEARQLNNDRNFFNNTLLTEGNIYLNLEKYEAASKNFNSLVINTDVQEKDYLASRAHLGLTKLHYAREDYKQSAVEGENALKLAVANNFQKEIL